jgi:hypothetical protein
VIKFVGALRVDPLTGRLSAALTDLPQVPVRRLSLSFDGGPGALLASPLSCGPAPATGRFTSYGGGPSVDSSVSVAIAGRTPGAPCAGAPPFAPRLLVNSGKPQAGKPSSFSTTLLRQDGEQLPRRFSVSLPAGMSAALGTVQACPEAGVAVGVCPSASRVGGMLARVGSGPSPAALGGDVFLTGPYRRAPFGLLIQMRAALGPFDLGTVAFRATAQVDGRTGRVTVTSDPLPEAIEGIPVRFQAIELKMDRPGFIRNPTSCGSARADATIEASGGALAAAASSFELQGCRRLGFRPHFHLAFENSGALRRGDNPGLRVSARLRQSDTSLRAMKLSLPKALRFDASGLGEICSRRDAAHGDCGEGARVGVTSARTSLLSQPLRGSIYVVQPPGQGQPDLWLDLSAMGVRVELRVRTAARHGHLASDLVGLPDMPLSALTMRLTGGEEGVFVLATGSCDHGRPRQLTSIVEAAGQNGARRRLRLPIEAKTPCR